ncbi:MAG TPA: helix-turn-helix domain-containing protein [Syntrophales bacterium]|nr:helix-turn-helix domain-containing protein [Syntrophales bacterium]
MESVVKEGKRRNRKSNYVEQEIKFLTQGEVASRFRVSQSTVINWRKRRLLDYFQAPGSTKVLYPVAAVEEFEKKSVHRVEEVVAREVTRKSPEISTRPDKVWRI